MANKASRAGLVLLVLLVVSIAPLTPLQVVGAGKLELPPLPDESLLSDTTFARPGFENVAQPFLARTRYLVAIRVDPASGKLAGYERMIFVNNTGALLDSVVVRLYQNAPFRTGRTMSITASGVNGQAVPGTYRDNYQTIYVIPLSKPLQPSENAIIDLAYQVTFPRGSFFYVSEPFPLIAVHDQTGWRMDITTKGLDWVYSESALSVVRIRTRATDAAMFSGTVKSAEHAQDGTATYTVVTGPVRNFVFAEGTGWKTIDASGGPVPIHVLYQDDQAAAQEIADITVNAMNFYDKTFGPYPYALFNEVSLPFQSGGEQYPSMVLTDNQRTSEYRRFITAHEVAHQWFYGIAGNDLLRHAWLDESTTQVAGYLFYKVTDYGSPTADTDYWSHVLTWYNRIRPGKKIDTAVERFDDFNDYMSNVYGGGAVFLRELGEKIGDNALMGGMHSYVQAVNLGVGTPQQFFDSVQAQTKIDLKPMFCKRIGIMC